jgi:hypothetical protein
MGTNYAQKANERAALADKLLEKGREHARGVISANTVDWVIAESQVHATLAVAYATLAQGAP